MPSCSGNRRPQSIKHSIHSMYNHNCHSIITLDIPYFRQIPLTSKNDEYNESCNTLVTTSDDIISIKRISGKI